MGAFAWNPNDFSGGGGSGNVFGPASSTDNAFARFNGTTGKILQNSLLTMTDSGSLTVNGDAHIQSPSTPVNLIIQRVSDTVGDAAGLYFAVSTSLTNTRKAAIFFEKTIDVRGDLLFNITNLSGNQSVSQSDVAGRLSRQGAWTLGAAAGIETHTGNGSLLLTRGLRVGNAAGTLAMIDLDVNTLSSTNQLAYYTGTFVGNATATASVRGFQADVSSHSSAITTDYVSAFAGQASAGTGSTVTRGILFDGASGFGGAGTISNSAYLADNRTFTGDYFINSTSTNPSLLSGPLTLSASEINFTNLPTSDPSVPGRLYRTGGAVMVSI